MEFNLNALLDTEIGKLFHRNSILTTITFNDSHNFTCDCDDCNDVLDEYIKLGEYNNTDVKVFLYRMNYEYETRDNVEILPLFVVIVRLGIRTLIYENGIRLYQCAEDYDLTTIFDEWLEYNSNLKQLYYSNTDRLRKYLVPTSTKSARNSCR